MDSLMTAYLLDSEDRIVSVRGPWDEFAKENNGDGLEESDICGHSIWEFISGDATRMWVEALFQLARVSGKGVERPYRCDSPELRRFMEMKILPNNNGRLEVEHRFIRTEPNPIRVEIRPKKTMQPHVRWRCSICGRVKFHDQWQEPSAVQSETHQSLLVTYTVCQDCKVSLPGSSAL